ncbi:MAG TPA: SNF2-related protein, partial [Steroidobacteraceae bacterium]|nr:SNF2-related protein [Steroidobacteraceae bacterium]
MTETSTALEIGDPSSADELGAVLHEGPTPVPRAGAYLTFVPDWRRPYFLLWGDSAKEQCMWKLGTAGGAAIVDRDSQIRTIEGFCVPVLAATRAMASMTTQQLSRLPASLAVWSLASKLLLELVARERIVPRIVTIEEEGGKTAEARFGVALSLPDDARRVAALARSFPAAAHAIPLRPLNTHHDVNSLHSNGHALHASVSAWRAEAMLGAYLDMAADALVRASVTTTRARSRAAQKVEENSDPTWSQRLIAALTQAVDNPDTSGATFAVQGFAERHLVDELHNWAQPALGGSAGLPRACFKLELPKPRAEASTKRNADIFPLRFFLEAHDDPDAVVAARDVYAEEPSVGAMHCEPRVAAEQLLKSLATAGRIFAPIGQSLREARPDGVDLNADTVAAFLAAAPAFREAGMSVALPAELTPAGQQPLRMRMRIGGAKSDAAESQTLEFRWEAELNGRQLSASDLAELAARKSPLVRFQDRWVLVDADQLKHAQKLLAQGGGTLTRAAALAAALGGVTTGEGQKKLPLAVLAENELAQLLEVLRTESPTSEIDQPEGLKGSLRPYQQRGYAWLAMMDRVQLGACLADDMGLGKSIQLLAFLLHRKQQRAQLQEVGEQAPIGGPILLVCPTSVLGNWQRELERFAPSLAVCAHYGPTRARDVREFEILEADTVVLTSYGLLRRDAEVLTAVPWAVAVLDEAQNIKNASSRTARVARALKSSCRVALTGTPMENRLVELWSIAEFLNPGLLGSFEGFRREIAMPIERFGREDIAARLKQIVRPFILRRVKSDPTVIQDLPSKQEMTVFCSLTREQASLYQSAFDTAMNNIESSDGIERRGQVLALITALKQICNHPAQYLHEAGPLGNRSGKLERLREMLDEALAAGDRVLVFTQYREMGDRLVRDLT